MTTPEILGCLRRLGVRLVVWNGRLRFTPKSKVPDELLASMREHKADLIDSVEAIDERSAILEFDGEISRVVAEREAFRIINEPKPLNEESYGQH